MIVFKSKLYRDEIKHWLLIVSLLVWAFIASYFALLNRERTLLIGIDELGTRLIVESNDRILKNELTQFMRAFVNNYYGYDQNSFSEQISLAADLMTENLWETQKPKLLELKEKLAKFPLSQSPEILSLDLVDERTVEALIELKIKSKLVEQKVKIKVKYTVEKLKRTSQNPWGLTISEMRDEVL